MPKILLTQSVVAGTICPDDRKKLDLYDTQTKGFVLEVRGSGGKTYYLRYQDTRGRTRQLRLADTQDVSLGQARILAGKARNRIALGEDPLEQKQMARATPTFVELVRERYLPFVMTNKRSWITDECLLRNHILPKIGKKYLNDITKADIIAIHHGRLKSGAAKGSANRLLILIRYIFNMAIRWEIPGITKNPTTDVPLFEDPPMKERFLSPEETARLYKQTQCSENPMLQFIVPMLILTGARKREVLDAKWEDFDVDRRQWRIPMTKAGKPRHVPLSDGALQILASVPRVDLCPYVFANPDTKKPYVSMFCSWDTARKRAGLADVRIHDLRHSFASFLVNAGRSLYEVQKILGHTQIKTTQRYAHLSQETLIDAANAAMAATGTIFTPHTLPIPPATFSGSSAPS